MSEAKELIKKMCDLQNSTEEIQKEMAGWSGVVQRLAGVIKKFQGQI